MAQHSLSGHAAKGMWHFGEQSKGYHINSNAHASETLSWD